MRLVIYTLFLLFGLTLLGGCGSPTRKLDANKWRSGVVRYVNDHANGDPSVLADITDAHGRTAFVMLGHPEPDRASDYHGLLVDVLPIGNRTAYVYMVGCVKKAELDSIQAATLFADPPKLKWITSKSEGDAFDTYRDYIDTQWRKQHSDTSETQPFYCGFPPPGDLFTARVSGNTITVTHPASGAKWTVEVR